MPSQSTESLVRFLLKNTPLTQAEAEVLTTRFEPVCLKENDYFLKAGMPVRKIGYLSHGILRQFNIDGKGNENIQQFIPETHFFTDLDGFYKQEVSASYIQAVIPCRLLTLSIAELETLRRTNPKMEPIISNIGMQHLLERVQTDTFLRTGTSTEQYRYFMTHFPNVARQVPLKYVASYLRITQQSLSRIRRQKR